jgi:hypothetical protein
MCIESRFKQKDRDFFFNRLIIYRKILSQIFAIQKIKIIQQQQQKRQH